MNADPLAGLRPLHLPEPVGWWPPAPLWWVAATLFLLAVVMSVRALLRHLAANRYRRAARGALAEALQQVHESGDRAAFLTRVSGILRRAALCRYPRAIVAPLHGREWLLFLDRSGRMQGFAEGPGAALGSAVYTRDPACEPEAIASMCRRWLRRHR